MKEEKTNGGIEYINVIKHTINKFQLNSIGYFLGSFTKVT